MRIILRAKKIIQTHMKINKMQRIVMFVYLNAVNYSALQPLNTHAQNKKQTNISNMKKYFRYVQI